MYQQRTAEYIEWFYNNDDAILLDGSSSSSSAAIAEIQESVFDVSASVAITSQSVSVPPAKVVLLSTKDYSKVSPPTTMLPTTVASAIPTFGGVFSNWDGVRFADVGSNMYMTSDDSSRVVSRNQLTIRTTLY